MSNQNDSLCYATFWRPCLLENLVINYIILKVDLIFVRLIIYS